MKKGTVIYPWMICFSALLLFFSGCGPKGLDVQFVEGVVTFDGEPFTDVTISFTPLDEGNPGFAATDANGYYRLTTLGGEPEGGTTVGSYAVSFDKTVPAGRRPTQAEMAADPEWESSGKFDMDRVEQLVPKQYVEPSTSGFTVDVKTGTNKFDFDLKSK